MKKNEEGYQCHWIEPGSLVRCGREAVAGHGVTNSGAAFCSEHAAIYDDDRDYSTSYLCDWADRYFPGMFLRAETAPRLLKGTLCRDQLMLIEAVEFGVDRPYRWEEVDHEAMDWEHLEEVIDDDDYWEERIEDLSDPLNDVRPILVVRHLDIETEKVVSSKIWVDSDLYEVKDAAPEEIAKLTSFWELLSWQASPWEQFIRA